MKSSQKVKFWIAQDDSGYASECFGIKNTSIECFYDVVSLNGA